MKSPLAKLTAPLAISLLLAVPLRAAEPAHFGSLPGGTVRIEGTSTVHDWQMEGHLIGGHLDAGNGFPAEPGQALQPGKVDAQAEVFIPVHSLTSVEKDGKPYSTAMDDIAYGKLKMTDAPRITYRLDELVLKEVPKTADAPFVFDSKGSLVVAGVTNQISMPVTVTPLGGKKLKIAGNVSVKMTDFGIEPPAPKIALGLIKTGDEVKLSFEWNLVEKTAPK
jgi:hypothetical protein